MRLILALAAAAAFAGGSALAQADHATHHPTEQAAAATPTHEDCMAVMGHKMDARQVHDHARDKTGMIASPQSKPLSEAEMQKMHEKCAAKMAKAEDKTGAAA